MFAFLRDVASLVAVVSFIAAIGVWSEAIHIVA